MSFWGNQTGYESQLHCLQQGLDSQTQGNHQGRPHSWHSLPAHSAGVATPKEAYSQNGQGILGLQRPALHRRGTAPDAPKVKFQVFCHNINTTSHRKMKTHTTSTLRAISSATKTHRTLLKPPPQELPRSKEHPIYHKPGSIRISSVEDLLRFYPNSFD